MKKLPKIEDRIEIVQDKFSDEFGHARFRTNAMDLPHRLPGFYYQAANLEGDDYEFVELENPLGKIPKDRHVTQQDLHDNWDASQKYLSKESMNDHLYYSTQQRFYPTNYQFQTHFPKFEEGKNALMESLQMLKVANRKLASYDEEINRLSKVKKPPQQEEEYGINSKLSTASYQSLEKSVNEQLDTSEEVLKPWKKEPSKNTSSVGTNHLESEPFASTFEDSPKKSKAIPDYYFFNADMKRVYERTKPGIDGTPVLMSPYVTDPAKAQEAFVLRHYGPASVMNIRPDSLFEVSNNKEITEKHMEDVVYRQSRKYGFMFDRRTKIKQRQRKGKRSISPVKSAIHAAAIAAGNSESFADPLPVHLRMPKPSPSRKTSMIPSTNNPELSKMEGGGGIRPLLNTRHVSLLLRDVSSTDLFNGKAANPINFSEAIEAAKKYVDESINAEEQQSPIKPTVNNPSTQTMGIEREVEEELPILDIDAAIHAAATTLAAALGENRDNITEELPLSARRHKTRDVFEEIVTPKLDTPTLRRSLSVTANPSRSLSRRLSRAASKANLSECPSKVTSSTPSPVRHRSVSASPSASSPSGSFSSPLVPSSPIISTRTSLHIPATSTSMNKVLFSTFKEEDENEDASARIVSQQSEEGNEIASQPASKRPSFQDKRPAPLSKDDSNLLTRTPNSQSPSFIEKDAVQASPLRKVLFSPERRASFVPSLAKPLQAPPTIKEETSTILTETKQEEITQDEEGTEDIPGFEYLTMMSGSAAKRQRKPSIAFSFNPVTGKIEDIHFQSLQQKRRPLSADLDKSTQRTLLRRLQNKSNMAFEYMRQQRRAKRLHLGKDLSQICKITPEEAEAERSALIDLYECCHGKHWIKQDNWCSDRPVGEWYGVSVNVEGFVFELHLSHNNLMGPFPDSVMYLPKLEVINLDHNHLSGDLPEYALQKCLHLTILSARHNMLTGYIKFDLLVHLSSLREIWLSDNRFHGDIQDGLTQMAALTHIDLDNNQLSGPIPRHINRLFNLQHFSVGRNQLTGHIAPGIMSLDRLETLSLYSNKLTGKIPLWLRSMPALQDLLLFDNCFDKEEQGVKF